MNMDVKQLVNLDAFTKGLNSTTKSLGGVIPIAAINMIESNVGGFGGSIPYSRELIHGAFFLWKSYTASNAMMNT